MIHLIGYGIGMTMISFSQNTNMLAVAVVMTVFHGAALIKGNV